MKNPIDGRQPREEQIVEVVTAFENGKLRRRDFLRRIVGLGVSTSVAYAALGAAASQAQQITTRAIGEESTHKNPHHTTLAVGEDRVPPRITTQTMGEEGRPHLTTHAIGEEGNPKPPQPTPTTMALGEEGQPSPGITTRRYGEEGQPKITTHAIGEETNPQPTTYRQGEEGMPVTTQAMGEEGGPTPTTTALGEEGGTQICPQTGCPTQTPQPIQPIWNNWRRW